MSRVSKRGVLLLIVFLAGVGLYAQEYVGSNYDVSSRDDRESNYKYSFGIKVCPPVSTVKASNYGYISLASFRLFFDNRTAWESNVILDPEQWQVNAFYEKYYPLSRNTYRRFRFYWGGGIEYGMNYKFAQRHRSIGSLTGIDYTIKNKRAPYCFTFDIGPYIIDVFAKEIKAEVRPNFGLRYCFNY